MPLASEDIHKLNKREAFDGMRAYHQSEIAHKKDCVDILKAILTAMLIVYGGLIGTAVSGKIDQGAAMRIAIVLLLFIALSVLVVVWASNRKIDQDNLRYRKYLDEYKLERLFLHLEEDMWERGYISAWFEPHDSNRTGYHYTKVILRMFGVLVIGSAAIATAIMWNLPAGAA